MTNTKNFKIGDFCNMYIYNGMHKEGSIESGQVIDINEGLYPEDGKMIDETKITILTVTGMHIQRLDCYCEKISESQYISNASNLRSSQYVKFNNDKSREYFGEFLQKDTVKYLGTNNQEISSDIRALTPNELKTAVFYKFCIDNYENGYDVFIECYSGNELEEYVLGHERFVDLMREAKLEVQARNEYMAEIF
ncbi:hypothetical protein NVP2275O_146 [Vibrio phage 2.275.O._10N.286.54.E11]|nr:hypothetical protein NVP2275O_146 [Vibrio phage 2.275.O._10N.286.54.E11]